MTSYVTYIANKMVTFNALLHDSNRKYNSNLRYQIRQHFKTKISNTSSNIAFEVIGMDSMVIIDFWYFAFAISLRIHKVGKFIC